MANFSFIYGSRKCHRIISLVLLPFFYIASANASVTIDDIPVSVQNAKANILFVLDNSGSMQNGDIPDYADNLLPIAHSDKSVFEHYPCLFRGYYSAQYNKMYYDPTVTYPLPYDSTGTQFTSSVTSFRQARVNPWTAVGSASHYMSQISAYNYPTGYADLTTNYFPYVGGCLNSVKLVTGNKVLVTGSSNRYVYYLSGTGANTLARGYVPANPNISAPTCTISSPCSTKLAATTNNPLGGLAVPGAAFYCAYLPDRTRSFSSTSSADTAIVTGDHDQWTCYLVGPYYDASGTAIARTVAQGADPNYTSLTDQQAQAQNFAIWYTFYYSRIQTMRSAMSTAFSSIGSQVRVGLYPILNSSSTVNKTGYGFVDIQDFTATQRSTVFNQLNTMAVTGLTPTPQGLLTACEYIRTGNLSGSAKTDPITNSCQQNFIILMSDGAWTDQVAAGAVTGAPDISNRDNTVPTLPNNSTNTSQTIFDPVAGVTLTPGSQWPRPYWEGPTATTNTLSDIAMYYWATDLRPGSCTVSGIEKCVNNVSTAPTSPDPANWQHIALFAVGFGVNGLRTYPTDLAGIKSGSLNWPPITFSGANPSDSSPIDDMWHATVNGHGQYFSANNVSEMQSKIATAVNSVVARSLVGNTVVFATPQISTPGNGVDNATFLSSYNSADWTGDLRAYPILASDNTTANISAGSIDTTAPLWPNQISTDPTSSQAQYLLDAKVAADSSSTKSSRYIVTHAGGNGNNQGIAFLPTSNATVGGTTSTLQSILGNDVVEYFRGVRTYEDGSTFRTRNHILGDIVNAEPAVALPPYRNYFDSCYANPVSGVCANTFKSAQQNRTRMLFQGANDGMLHAFNAAISTDTQYANRGKENWAYIPNLVLAKMTGSLATSPANIHYSHNYFVDGSPVIGDVDFNNTQGASGNPDWRTILVGGLGKGGRGYYALDITTPLATSESDAASKVLWEFPNPASPNVNMGFSFGRPAIVKTQSNGWVVLVPSGYNNGTASGDSGGDGHGHLFVLNAKTGALIADIATTGDGGTGASASNLGHISAHVGSNATDATVDYAYGVTLGGQVWRFNLTTTVKDSSGVSYTDQLGSGSHTSLRPTWVATLKDSAGSPQPITTEPEIATITIDGAPKRFVYVTTGKYLASSDLTNTQTQTAYGFIDDTSVVSNATPIYDNPRSATVSSTSRSLLLQQSLQTSGSTRTITGQTNSVTNTTVAKNVDYADGQIGWYVDFPSTGERVVSRPILIPPGALVFNSNAPSTDVCLPGGTTWLNVFEYKNGGQVSGLNWASSQLSNSNAGGGTLGVSIFQGQDGRIGFQVPGQPTTFLPQSTSQPPSHRVSWREIPEQ